MNEYTVDDYRAAAQRAVDAGNMDAAKELARRGIALQNNPKGTGLGRAVQRGYHSTIAGGNQFIGTLQGQKVANYTVDADETFRRALNLQLKQDVNTPLPPEVAGMSQDQILDYFAQQRGYGPKWRERVVAMTTAAEGKKQDYRESGELAEDEAAIAKTAERIRERLKKVDSLPYSPAAQKGLEIFRDADGVIDWAAKSFKNPLESLAFIGEVAAESGPSLAAGAATSVLTGNPVAGAGVMIMASAPREYGGQVGAFLAENGIDMTDPSAIADALKNPQLMDKAHAEGLTKASIVSAFEALGMKAGGGFLRQTVAQATTGGAGEAASQVAIEGEITSPKEVALEAVAELATTPGEAVIRSGSLFNKDGSLNENSAEGNAAAASVAQRLRRIAQNNDYNLKDANRGGGAMNALENTRNEIVSEIDVLRAALSKQLKPNQSTQLSELIDVYAQAQAGIKQGKTKVANKVTQENFEAIKALVSGIKEGDLLLQKLQESNVVTDLFQNGLKGGISQYTDYFNPLSASGTIYDPGRGANIATSVLTGGSLFALGGPAALGVQGATVAGGRAVDALTGRRSRVNRFVRANQENQPFIDPTSPSIRDIEAQTEMAEAEARRQQQEDLARAKDEYGAYDTDKSPIGTMLLGTGLDREGLKTTLTELKEATDGSYVAQMAQSALDNLNGDTNQILDLTELITLTNSFLNKNNNQERRVAAPDSLLAQRELLSPSSAETAGGAAGSAPSPNYEKGVMANQAIIARLKNDMLSDMDVSARDKALLEVSLDNITKPLGKSPVDAIDYIADSLVKDGVDPAAIEAYIKPYRERVEMQQMTQPTMPSLPEAEGAPNELSFEEAMATIPAEAPAQPSLAQALQDTPPDELSAANAPILAARTPPPTLPEVKTKSEPTKALFEIGKPGGAYENGIQDLNTAAELSAALGQTVSLFSNYQDFIAAIGYEEDNTRSIRGLFRSANEGTKGHVFGLLPGAQLPNGSRIESVDALTTFLHELSHGLAKGDFAGSDRSPTAALQNNTSWEAVINGVLSGKSNKTRAKVRSEIIDLQENRDVSTILKPNDKRPVRLMREKLAEQQALAQNMIQRGATQQMVDQTMKDIDANFLNPYQDYYRSRSEFAVDPLWVYLINPKLAKKIMPETTKLIADNFKRAQNPKLRFYAHPLGMAVAIIMAMMFGAGEEEPPQQVA